MRTRSLSPEGDRDRAIAPRLFAQFAEPEWLCRNKCSGAALSTPTRGVRRAGISIFCGNWVLSDRSAVRVRLPVSERNCSRSDRRRAVVRWLACLVAADPATPGQAPGERRGLPDGGALAADPRAPRV